MRDVRKVCHDHNIYEHRAIWAAEMMQQIIIEDLQTMLLHDTVRPLHERLAEYIKDHDRSSERAET